MKSNLYSDKPDDYYSGVRHDLISLLPSLQAKNILELGAGTGQTLDYIKRHHQANFTVGIDILKPKVLPPSIDQFLTANIEVEPIALESGFFDVIICGDVLEHLIDPWTVVKRMLTWLKPGGIFVCSIPNIREASVLYSIFLAGDLRYQDNGILDRSHLRFFCKKNMSELLQSAGLTGLRPIPTYMLSKGPSKRRILHYASVGLLEEFLAIQYAWVGIKP